LPRCHKRTVSVLVCTEQHGNSTATRVLTV
jgi:hypothetical protein